MANSGNYLLGAVKFARCTEGFHEGFQSPSHFFGIVLVGTSDRFSPVQLASRYKRIDQ